MIRKLFFFVAIFYTSSTLIQAYNDNLCTDTGLVDGLMRVCLRSLPEDDVIAKWYRNNVKEGTISNKALRYEKNNELQESRTERKDTSLSVATPTHGKPALLTASDLSELRHFIRMLRLLIDTTSYGQGMEEAGSHAIDNTASYNVSVKDAIPTSSGKVEHFTDDNSKPEKSAINPDHQNSDDKRTLSVGGNAKFRSDVKHGEIYSGLSSDETNVLEGDVEPVAVRSNDENRILSHDDGKMNSNKINITTQSGLGDTWRHQRRVRDDLRKEDLKDLKEILRQSASNTEDELVKEELKELDEALRRQGRVTSDGSLKREVEEGESSAVDKAGHGPGGVMLTPGVNSLVESQQQEEYRILSSQLDQLASQLSEKPAPTENLKNWKSGRRTGLLVETHHPLDTVYKSPSDEINDRTPTDLRIYSDDLELPARSSSLGNPDGKKKNDVDIRILEYLENLLQRHIDSKTSNQKISQQQNSDGFNSKLKNILQQNKHGFDASLNNNNNKPLKPTTYDLSRRRNEQLVDDVEQKNNNFSAAYHRDPVYSSDHPASAEYGNRHGEEKVKQTLLDLLSKSRKRIPRSVHQEPLPQPSEHFRDDYRKPTEDNKASTLRDLLLRIKIKHMKELLDSISAISSRNSTGLLMKFLRLYEFNRKGSMVEKGSPRLEIRPEFGMEEEYKMRSEESMAADKELGSEVKAKTEEGKGIKQDEGLVERTGSASNEKQETGGSAEHEAEQEHIARPDRETKDPEYEVPHRFHEPEIRSKYDIKLEPGIITEAGVKGEPGIRSMEGKISEELSEEKRKLVERRSTMEMAAQQLLIRCCMQGCSDYDLMDFCHNY